MHATSSALSSPRPRPDHRPNSQPLSDKETGKPKGFAFLAYADQRSTNLAVDNLAGMRLGGRTVRVEHVDDYRMKLAELGGGEALPPPPPVAGGRGNDRAAAAAAAEAAGATVVRSPAQMGAAMSKVMKERGLA